MSLPARFLAFGNRLGRSRRPVRVWDLALSAPTFDRWLYLRLHRAGRMGGAERRFFAAQVKPGMQVADVGANLGLYSLLLARLVGPTGRVFAFEPDPLMAEALRQNLAANAAGQVELFPCAVGAAAGTGTLRRTVFNSGDNRLWSASGPGRPRSDGLAVPIIALEDALRGRRVDFIKMDVQGWEGEALRGLGGLLRANPGLSLYFEFWPKGLLAAGTSVRDLQGLLHDLGLTVFRTEPGLDKPAPDLEGLAATMKPGAYLNLLARRP